MFLPKKIKFFYLQSGTNLRTSMLQDRIELSTINICSHSEPSVAEVNFENLKTDVENPWVSISIKLGEWNRQMGLLLQPNMCRTTRRAHRGKEES